MDEIQQEMKIRRRIIAIYDEPRDNFDNKDAWDAYLENMEEIIYNLTYGIDALAMENRIAEYERVKKTKAARSTAAQDTPASTSGSYAPSSRLGAGSFLAPAVPLAKPKMNDNGDFIRERPPRPTEACRPMDLAAGWTEDIVWRRQRNDSYGAIF